MLSKQFVSAKNQGGLRFKILWGKNGILPLPLSSYWRKKRSCLSLDFRLQHRRLHPLFWPILILHSEKKTAFSV